MFQKNQALKRKQEAYRLGLRAERLAAWYLRLKGFAILERRYKTHYGEIDIIARRFNLVLIVEVKHRPTLKEAIEAVDEKAQHRIESSADYWLARQKHKAFLRLRFDLIAFYNKAWPKHIHNFFSKTEN